MKKIFLVIVSFLTITISLSIANSNEEKKFCSGFAKWTKDCEFKQVRESKCMTESEYQAYINSPDYLCKYYTLLPVTVSNQCHNLRVCNCVII